MAINVGEELPICNLAYHEFNKLMIFLLLFLNT